MSNPSETNSPCQHIIRIAKIRLWSSPGKNTRAFVDLRIGPFVLKGFTVIQTNDGSGFFVSPPSIFKENKNHPIVFVDQDYMDKLRSIIVTAYMDEEARIGAEKPENTNYSLVDFYY